MRWYVCKSSRVQLERHAPPLMDSSMPFMHVHVHVPCPGVRVELTLLPHPKTIMSLLDTETRIMLVTFVAMHGRTFKCNTCADASFPATADLHRRFAGEPQRQRCVPGAR